VLRTHRLHYITDLYYQGRRPQSLRRRRETCWGLFLPEFDQSAGAVLPEASSHPSVSKHKRKRKLSNFHIVVEWKKNENVKAQGKR